MYRRSTLKLAAATAVVALSATASAADKKFLTMDSFPAGTEDWVGVEVGCSEEGANEEACGAETRREELSKTKTNARSARDDFGAANTG